MSSFSIFINIVYRFIKIKMYERIGIPKGCGQGERNVKDSTGFPVRCNFA